MSVIKLLFRNGLNMNFIELLIRDSNYFVPINADIIVKICILNRPRLASTFIMNVLSFTKAWRLLILAFIVNNQSNILDFIEPTKLL